MIKKENLIIQMNCIYAKTTAFSDFVVEIQGPRVGACLTLRNELSEETHVLTKQETLLGRGAGVESSRIGEPRRTALPCGSQSRVLW